MNAVYAMPPDEATYELARLGGLVGQYRADRLPESLTTHDEQIDSAVDPLTDAEIIETVAATFSLTHADAVERLAMIDFAAARERLAA